MSEDILSNLILSLQQHSTLALLFVFIVAFSESLIIVGIIVPGAILMVLFGALIAMDALEFWPTVFIAMLGAISGDSLSYWLGRRYNYKLQTIWPLSNHPEIITRANEFFDKHGSKSIVFSRFVGLLRPVIPAIAGMSNMPIKIFLAANISSAIFWAPLYLLPGILFGLSIEMASEFASKFILLIILILLSTIIILQASQRLYVFSKPLIEQFINHILQWSKKHTLLGEIPLAVFDKEYPEIRGLTFLALIIFITTLIFTIANSSLFSAYNPLYYNFDSLDRFIYFTLQKFRSPPLDNTMLWFSYIGSSHFFALLSVIVGGLLIYKKDFYTLWHLLAAITLPLLIAPMLANDLSVSLQQNLNIFIQPLPFIVIISAIGYLTIVVNSKLSFQLQKFVYYFTATLVLTLVMAQLYFATQVFSQIMYGFFVGGIWFNLLGTAYRRHNKQKTGNNINKNLFVIVLLLLIYPSIKTYQQDTLYTPPDNYFVMGTNSWLESGWKLLPVIRAGVNQKKNEVFNLQWLGTIRNISQTLKKSGFSDSINSSKTIANWFLKDININQLPILPHIHQGKYETLRYYLYDKKNNELAVIRLWPSEFKLKQDNPVQPLWFGSISYVEIKKHLGVTYLVTKQEKITEIKLDDNILTIDKRIIVNNDEERTIFLVRYKN